MSYTLHLNREAQRQGTLARQITERLNMETILVIDDDLAVQHALRRTFAASGFAVAEARDCTSAVQIFDTIAPRLVILEMFLPGGCGADLCRLIRRKSSTVPIIVLSSDCDEVDKVLLLEVGADDYVTKPFSPRELLARVRVALRRLERPSLPSHPFMFDDVVVNFQSMELSRLGRSVHVTTQEFNILQYFVQNQGRVISDLEFLNQVWKNRRHPNIRTIKTHILHLRQKLESDPRRPTHFQTVPRFGYKFIA